MTCCLKLFSSFFVCDQLLVAACDWWEVLAVTLTDCICVCAEKDNKSKYFPLAVMTDIWLCLFCQSVCFACLCCLCKCVRLSVSFFSVLFALYLSQFLCCQDKKFPSYFLFQQMADSLTEQLTVGFTVRLKCAGQRAKWSATRCL